jgi:hypothetical protein
MVLHSAVAFDYFNPRQYMKTTQIFLLCSLLLSGCGNKHKSDVTIIDMKTLPSYDACLAEATADLAKRSDVQSVTEEHKEDGHVGLYMAQIKLKTGGMLRQLCQIGLHDTTATYSLMGVGSGIKPGLEIKPGLQIPGGFTLLETKTFSTRSECQTEATAAIAKRPDVQSVSDKDNLGSNYTVINLKSGGALVQLCDAVSGASTAYYLMGKGPGAVP